jgi:nicotinate-nucleotide adenylyltransferase
MRVGLLPGSFDPPHHGHIALARQARDAAQLDLVLFYPNSFNPDKPALAALHHRRAMLEMTIDTSFMALTPSQFSDRPQVIGEYDFLPLIEALPRFVGCACEVVMIRGSDYFSPTMIDRYPSALAQLQHVIGVRDPLHWRFDYGLLPAATLIECTPMSSTEVKQRLLDHPSPAHRPDPIEAYCRRHRLYHCQT